MKDKDDVALEALFASEPIADDGFSRKVVSRIRRRMWIQRLALPTAFSIGLAIAAASLVKVVGALSGVVATLLPIDRIGSVKELLETTGALNNASTVTVIAIVAVAAMFLLPALDDGA